MSKPALLDVWLQAKSYSEYKDLTKKKVELASVSIELAKGYANSEKTQVIDFKGKPKNKINNLRSVSIVSMDLGGLVLNPEEQADFDECLEERSAIIEYEGGLPRQEAELQARVICLTEYWNKRGIKA